MQTFLRKVLAGFLLLTILVFPACKTNEGRADKNVIHITTTTGMIGDIAKNIGKQHVRVTSLMGPGVDPHLYKASQGDIKRLEDADIIFYNGLSLEGKMEDIFAKMVKSKEVVGVTDRIPSDRLLKTAKGYVDPHLWFDIQHWMKASERVLETLIKVDPKHKKEYEQLASDYLDKLADLDKFVRKEIASIPKQQRVLVTAHDAFGYFGKAYDMEVIGLQGISTASEYGIKDVQRIVDLLTSRKIKAVFIESSVPKKSIEAVVLGAKQKNHTVVIGGTLYSDAMGKKGTAEGTYIGMVRHNVNTIAQSLK